MDGPIQYRLFQFQQGHSFKATRLLNGFSQVNQHDDPGGRRHSEAGDVTNSHGN